MNKGFLVILTFVFGILSAQQNAYYQQFAKYKMDIDVDAPNFTYKGAQTLTYTNNSPDELNVVYFHLYLFRAGNFACKLTIDLNSTFLLWEPVSCLKPHKQLTYF